MAFRWKIFCLIFAGIAALFVALFALHYESSETYQNARKESPPPQAQDTDLKKAAPGKDITAKAFLAVRISSGGVLLEKNSRHELPIASLTKLMTAAVASEEIGLDASITLASPIQASSSSAFRAEAGETYTVQELLYPLLIQSSNGTAEAIAAFYGEEKFMRAMNEKAKEIGMRHTRFADSSGKSPSNISTAEDIAVLLEYLYESKRFLFDITKGKMIGGGQGRERDLPALKNYNEFADDPNLVGMKNGQTFAARETLAGMWNIHTDAGIVPVAVVVLGSENRMGDTELLLERIKIESR